MKIGVGYHIAFNRTEINFIHCPTQLMKLSFFYTINTLSDSQSSGAFLYNINIMYIIFRSIVGHFIDLSIQMRDETRARMTF